MKQIFFSTIILLSVTFTFAQADLNLGQLYIDSWKGFYPSRAFAQGMQSSIFYVTLRHFFFCSKSGFNSPKTETKNAAVLVLSRRQKETKE